MTHKFKWLIVQFTILIFLVSCANPQLSNNDKVIKIVTSFPMQKIALGKSSANSVKLALSEVDYQVRGYTIELVILDDGKEDGQWVADKERQNAEQAVNDPQVVAYIGPLNSGAAKISIPIINKGGLLQISHSNTWPGLTKVGFAPGEPGIFYPTGRRNYFRTAPTDDLQAPAAVNWALELGFETVYILDDGETYGKGLADLFEAFAGDSDLNVVGHQTIDKTTQDYTDILSEIKDLTPPIDLIYFGGFSANGAPVLVKQMQELDMEASFMGPDAIVDTAFIEQAGEAAEGVYATLVGLPPTQLTEGKGKAFVEAYTNAYGAEPEAFSHLAYDATQVILQAIEKADSVDRAGILNAVKEMNSLQGAAGAFQFDKNGDTTLLVISGNVVQDQSYKFVDTLPTR